MVFANPPFKGAIDAADVNPTLPVKCKKTEILFLHLFLRLLENGGRAAFIVSDGVLFGSVTAHVDIRGGCEPHAAGQVQEDRDPFPPPLSALTALNVTISNYRE